MGIPLDVSVTRTLAATALLATIHCMSAATVVAEDVEPTFRLVFPTMRLDPRLNQAMEEIRFTVACGHIETVGRIPELWNVEINRAISAVEEFHASAGLGAARPTNPADWSGAIIIKRGEESCFHLAGAIVIAGDEYLEFKLSNVNLHRLKRKR